MSVISYGELESSATFTKKARLSGSGGSISFGTSVGAEFNGLDGYPRVARLGTQFPADNEIDNASVSPLTIGLALKNITAVQWTQRKGRIVFVSNETVKLCTRGRLKDLQVRPIQTPASPGVVAFVVVETGPSLEAAASAMVSVTNTDATDLIMPVEYVEQRRPEAGDVWVCVGNPRNTDGYAFYRSGTIPAEDITKKMPIFLIFTIIHPPTGRLPAFVCLHPIPGLAEYYN